MADVRALRGSERKDAVREAGFALSLLSAGPWYLELCKSLRKPAKANNARMNHPSKSFYKERTLRNTVNKMHRTGEVPLLSTWDRSGLSQVKENSVLPSSSHSSSFLPLPFGFVP